MKAELIVQLFNGQNHLKNVVKSYSTAQAQRNVTLARTSIIMHDEKLAKKRAWHLFQLSLHSMIEGMKTCN